MLISEIFGRHVKDTSVEADRYRIGKLCPFKGGACTKSSKTNPLGICTLPRGSSATAICPTRFLEGDIIFKAAAEVAFGKGIEFAVFPEIKLLHLREEKTGKTKKIGKIDFLLGKVDEDKISDFAALEIQSTYFSGFSIRSALEHYLATKQLDVDISNRRPDFRSSAQKRLMPQLQLKVPIFRRWGKKFFVVVDSEFYDALPRFKETSVANSEIIWLAFPIEENSNKFQLGKPVVHGTHWDDVATALREGTAPEPEEIYDVLEEKLGFVRRLTT